MRDIDELRHALAAEAADLHVDLPVPLIRRRARRIRTRRTALIAAALVVVLAIPAGVLAAVIDRRPPPDSGPVAPVCVTPGADGTVPWVGAPVEVLSGAPIRNFGVHQVLVGVVYTPEKPVLAVVYHHEETGINEYGAVSSLSRNPSGAFPGGDEERLIVALRVNYGGLYTIDLGLYAGLADRVTIESGGTTIEAGTVANRETGWTFFWSRQDLVSGEEPVTLTAYDDDRVVASAPGTAGPGAWDVPEKNPAPVDFPPTCS